MSYDIVALGDVCEFLDSQRVPITESDRRPGPYPYYGANGQQDSIDSYIFDEPLVLLAEDGGHFGSKDKPIAYKVTGKCWVNNHAHVLRPKRNIDVDYLHRVLSYYDVTKYVNGTTRQKLTKGNAENITFPLPPLTEQKRIASLLARADRLRQLRRTAHELRESLLQSVFLEMFGNPMRNEKGWKRTEIREVAKMIVPTRDKPKSFSGDIPWITLPDLNGLFVGNAKNLLTENEAAEVGNRLMPENTVLLSCAGSLGKIAITTRPVYANQQFYGLVTKANDLHYVFLAMQLKIFGEEFFFNIAGMSTLGFFSKDKALDIEIILPPLSLQEEFASVVARVESLRGRMSEAERQVEGLFQSLLSQSFGK